MKKFLQAILVIALFIAALGSGLKAEAATLTKVSKITVKPAIVYTNGDSEIKVTYKWTTSSKLYDKDHPLYLNVSPSNRGIANATAADWVTAKTTTTKSGTTFTTTAYLKVDAKANGSAKITFTAPHNKKSATSKVTVKTLSEGIAGPDLAGVEVAERGSYAFSEYAIATNGVPSDKTVKYSILKIFKSDGVTEVKKASDKAKYASVKKNVLTTKQACTVVISAKANDKNSGAVEFIVTTVSNKIDSVKILGTQKKNKKVVDALLTSLSVNLKTNNGANVYEPVLKVESASTKHVVNLYEDLDITSSNEKVAVVDPYTGAITAVGNGKAVITYAAKLGNNAKAKITVNVTTDVAVITAANVDANGNLFDAADPDKDLIANGTKYPIGASVNSSASKQTLTYSISDVVVGTQKITKKNDIKKTIAVSNKGVVTAKKACTATITVKASNGLTKKVYVKTVKPVTAIKFRADLVKKAKNKSAYSDTVYITKEEDTDIAKNYFEGLVIEGDPSDDSVTYASSNTAIATVDAAGDVTVTGTVGGTATLTATANDGSGKKATVKLTVKIDAYEININKKAYTESEVTYIDVPADKNITAAAAIGAYVNKNATTQGVKYNVTKAFKVTAGAEKVITVTAKDTRSKTAKAALTKKVTLRGVATEDIANAYTLTVGLDDYSSDFDTFYTKKDAKGFVKATANCTDTGKKELNELEYSSSNSNILTVDAKTGAYTAKKTGEVTVSVKIGTAEVTKKVVVGRSDAEVEKELENAIAAGLKAEDRSYLGGTVAFNAANNTFDINVIDPEATVSDKKNTGMVDLFKTLPKSVWTADITGDEYCYLLTRGTASLNIQTFRVGNPIIVDNQTFDDVEAGIEYLRGLIADETIEDKLVEFVGRTYTVAVKSKEGEFTYDNKYTVSFDMDDKLFETGMDKSFDFVIKEFQKEIAGYENLVNAEFDTSKNVIKIDVIDEDESVETVLDAYINAYKNDYIFADNVDEAFGLPSKSTTVNIYDSEYGDLYSITEENVSFPLSDTDIAVYRERLADKIANKTLKNFARKTISVVSTVDFGSKEYKYAYTVEFAVGKAAIEFRTFNSIVDELGDDFTEEYEFGTITYDDAAKTFVVEATGDQTFEAAYSSDLANFFTVLTGDDDVVSAKVVNTAGKIVEVTGANLKSEVAVFKALTNEASLGAKLSTVNSQSATVKVTYANGVTMNYTVVFDTPAPEAPAPGPNGDVTPNGVSDDYVDVTTNDAE